jgi:hypothetical protein
MKGFKDLFSLLRAHRLLSFIVKLSVIDGLVWGHIHEVKLQVHNQQVLLQHPQIVDLHNAP